MLKVKVSVKAGARQSTLVQLDDGSFRVQLKSPPVDGKANAELLALMAEHFGVAKAKVQLKSGAGASNKWLSIDA
jgi:uncharacterized protein